MMAKPQGSRPLSHLKMKRKTFAVMMTGAKSLAAASKEKGEGLPKIMNNSHSSSNSNSNSNSNLNSNSNSNSTNRRRKRGGDVGLKAR